MNSKLLLTVIFAFIIPLQSQNFWTPVGTLAGGDFVQSMAVTPNESIIAASWYVGIYSPTNNETSWSQQFGGSGIYNLSAAPNGNIYALRYGVSSIGISRSTDDGITWNSVFTKPVQFNYYWGGDVIFLPNGIIIASMTQPDGQFIGQNAAIVLRSNDGGISWSNILQVSGATFTDFTLSDNKIFAACFAIGRPAAVFSSDNWNSFSNTNLFSVGLGYNLQIDAAGNIYTGVWTGDNVTEKLYKSTDAGSSWNSAGLPGENVLSLFISSNGYIYAGTDLFSGNIPKIRRSTNNSQTWEQINS